LEDDQWNQEAEALRGLIEGQNLEIEGAFYFKNIYNSPSEVTNLRNEVWWVKK